MKEKTKKIIGVIGLAGVSAIPSVFATPILESDALTGLSYYGTNIGSFLSNLTPGLTKFIFSMAIILAIVGLFVAIIMVVKKIAGKGLSMSK